LGSAVIFILILLAGTAPRSLGQGRPQLKRPEEGPEAKPAETKKPKKGKEPRAVAVLQLNSGGKGTLIPIAILIDGRFYDASVYKADPVPMALESGTVYEAEQAGDSQGLFTVIGALHSKNPGASNPWVGTGNYVAHGAEIASPTHKAENVPVGLDNSDEPPRLTRGSGSKGDGSKGDGSKGDGSKGAAADSASTATRSGADSAEKPGTSDHDTAKTASPASSDKPGDVKAQAAGAQANSGQTTASQASSDQADQSADYYRPTLRRGKPTQSAPQEDEATPKTGKASSAGAVAPANPGAISAGSVNPEPVQLVPAISDAGGPDPKSYKFFWKTGEEEERRNQMLALAGAEVRAYARAQVRNQIPARPPAAKAAAASRKAVAKPEEPLFENLQFRTFDVWLNSQPIMILTAEAHFPPATGAPAATAPPSYSVALVAKTDIYGNLRKLYSGVTDKFHLDVTPRLELIDAVDADGDGRAELLFRETSDAGSGYVIYRATADKLWKMFDNLTAE